MASNQYDVIVKDAGGGTLAAKRQVTVPAYVLFFMGHHR